jgi:diguanylate cyclase (GGDEF)-like protein
MPSAAAWSKAERRDSLVRRLTRWNLLVLALALLLSVGLLLRVVHQTGLSQQRADAEAAAALLAQNLAPMLAFQDAAAGRDLLAELARRRDLLAVRVLGTGAVEFARWQATAPPASTLWPPAEFELKLPVRMQGELLGWVTWRESNAGLERTLAWVALGGGLILCGALLLTWLLLAWVQRRALQPLIELARLTERVASTQDYSLRAGVVRADEVGRLSSRVNDLLHRVELWHAELNERLRREQEAGAQYQQLAQHDHLTGLPNRMAFELELESRLVKAQAQQRQLALFFIDLDGFKTINDQLGHAAGDQALKSAAERMLQVLRSEDRLFRLGGDEFALLVSPQGEDMPAQLASRLVSAVSQPFEVEGSARAAGRQHRPVLLPQRRQRPGRPAAPGRCRHVPGQGRRQERLAARQAPRRRCLSCPASCWRLGRWRPAPSRPSPTWRNCCARPASSATPTPPSAPVAARGRASLWRRASRMW